MDIAFIHPQHPGSEGTGSAHDATLIVETLEDLGHDVVPFCGSNPEEQGEDYETIGASGIHPHTLTRLNRGTRKRIPELSRFDVVHSYLPLVPALDELSRDTTTVMSLQSFKAVCPKMDLRYMNKEKCRKNGTLRCLKCSIRTSGGHADHGRMYRSLSRIGDLRLIESTDPTETRIDAFHALSTHVRDTFVDFGYPSERIKVIPSILDERFLVGHTSDFEAPYKFLHVGFLREAKGVQILPKFVEHLDDMSDYGFTLTIVGDGPLREKLQWRVRELDLTDLVHFKGHVEHQSLPSIYANHDVFVFPALWDEPFGRVLIESLAAGTPVVATDSGAASSIIGEAGIIAEPNPQDLAAAVHHMVSRGLLEATAKAAPVRAKRYLSESVGPMFDALYEEIM